MRRLHSKLSAIGLLLFAFSLPAFADKKDDLYNAAQKAIAAGDVITAAKNFCEVAKIDSGYKDAQQNCNIMRDSAAREEKKNEERFNDGVRAFQSGDLDTAEQKFKNVRGGSHVDEAKQYMASKIPAARAAKASSEGESAAAAKYSEGVQAYNSNNFSAAKADFGAVTSGKNAGEAQTYLTKIRQYEQAIAEGDRLAGAKNFRAAVSSYTDAANIKGDGPGDPRSKIGQMNQLAAGGGGGTTTTASTTTPSNTHSSSTLLDTGKPKLDISRTLHEADAALAKKDYGEAKRKYGAVLAEDSRNAQAQAGLAQVKSLNTAPTTSAAGEVDPLQPILVKAILEYYSQKFDDAEYHLRAYLDNSGSKSGLAQFYLGASRLTRYFLGGEQPSDQKLLKSAQDAFRDAKRTAGFKAPTKQYVSPKILKTFEETTS